MIQEKPWSAIARVLYMQPTWPTSPGEYLAQGSQGGGFGG